MNNASLHIEYPRPYRQLLAQRHPSKVIPGIPTVLSGQGLPCISAIRVANHEMQRAALAGLYACGMGFPATPIVAGGFPLAAFHATMAVPCVITEARAFEPHPIDPVPAGSLLISELRRRAYLSAMQVASWLPRVELPFAAPSRAELLQAQPELEPEPEVPAAPLPVSEKATPIAAPRPAIDVPRPSAAAKVFAKPEVVAEPEPAPVVEAKPATPPPRFALQLLRAGDCALLVELATGEPFQSRDPSYLLLKDLLRAAGLPDAPQQVGDGSPIRWPLLTRGNLDQGPDAARDYVQGVLAGQLEAEPCRCLWLVGLPAVRFAGEADEEAYNRELQVEGLGTAWALPSLELLMDEPQRKAELWRAMRRIMPRWRPGA